MSLERWENCFPWASFFYTYAIQPSSTSSTLWRTATRTKTSWPTKAALFWPYQVRAEEMQHPWIPARGTCRRQGSVEFDMCHWSEESHSSSRTSSKWSPCSKTCSGCSYSSWTCLSSLRQNLCFELRSPQSPSCPLMTVQQTTTSVQRLRRNWRTTISKQASKHSQEQTKKKAEEIIMDWWMEKGFFVFWARR